MRRRGMRCVPSKGNPRVKNRSKWKEGRVNRAAEVRAGAKSGWGKKTGNSGDGTVRGGGFGGKKEKTALGLKRKGVWANSQKNSLLEKRGGKKKERKRLEKGREQADIWRAVRKKKNKH